MKILVLNAGSSSLKYSLFDMSDRSVLLAGLIERIGESQASHRYAEQPGAPIRVEIACANHQQALSQLFQTLADQGLLANPSDLTGIGHRVVHGGEYFRQPALIDAEVIQRIADVVPLAPLHNPANLSGITEAMSQMPATPQVAVFDTAFHQTLPDYAFRYPLPQHLYTDHGVRRYGFHGTSHAYVAKQAAAWLGKPLAATNLITLHLGNGASATAIAGGVSVDTSMGMTPLEGLMMGSRCGDIDPAIAVYLVRTLGLDIGQIDTLFNKASGCLGVCGENDMRAIHLKAEQGDESARLALAMYAFRIKKYIGAYFAVLGRVDALVFTGGIGENDAWIRQTSCDGLAGFGISIDEARNNAPSKPIAAISPKCNPVSVLVIDTNEELEIALQTLRCLGQAPVSDDIVTALS